DPVAGKPLRIVKAIELGHIFKLGTKYSDSMGAKFLDADGREKPIIMGSYGIGVERILACFIEQNHDDSGIIWKAPISPFHAHIIGLNMKKFDDVKITAEDIYDKLNKAGFDALIDDRDESPGIKFNDADLIGIPVQIIVGSKNLKNGNLEIKFRRGGERKLIPADRLIEEIKLFYS
ncbi:MAG: His/Gly/Thr/Pro-type tRNA ligase C-terminal domain-containing protein, partial [Bacteroidota bacterium]